jgi:hypothetical protein
LDASTLEDFDFAMRTRERADYSHVYGRELAEDILESSQEVL